MIDEANLPAPRVRFDRNEVAGSFGDIGTDLPLILAMIAAAGLDGGTVFLVFGILQIASGLLYGLPMPMQPLKAMAVIIITHQVAPEVIFGGGLAIGVIMLVLAVSGMLDLLARLIPKSAVRGVQLGLGLSLASLALTSYVPSNGTRGWVLATIGFVVAVALHGSRRFPAALILIAMGLVYASIWTWNWDEMAISPKVPLPEARLPSLDAIWTGFLVLALPQIPLSLSNSVIATKQTLHDLFPQRAISLRKIGLTYGLSNLFASLVGGIPVCHGCGGLAGHHAFGARTGGSVVLYGSMYVILGVVLGDAVTSFVHTYPLPILGVILLFEAVALMVLIRDMSSTARQFFIVLTVGVIAASVKQGFLIGLLVGCAMHYWWWWCDFRKAARQSLT